MAVSPLLIKAKIRPPHPGPHTRRERLLQRLRHGLGRRLTLVVAGPGYGKTVLLAGFVREQPLPFAWYQVDEGDGDLVRFLWHLLAALEPAVTGGLPGMRALLSSTALPLRDPGAAGATLLADLERADLDGLVLCLDDWHLVPAGSEVATFVRWLVPYLPGYVHLYLAGRSAGDLPVQRWRLQGWLEELEPAELRFDTAETADLLCQLYGPDLPPEAVASSLRFTEGWAAGLLLLGRSWRAAPAEGVGLAPGDTAALGAYLDSEVMQRLSEPQRQFLLDTAVLEDLAADLCDALRDRADSAQFLADLARDGLFTCPVDPEQGVYRHHALFREYLLQRLRAERGPDAAAQQQRRLAALLARGGDPQGAIRWFLQGGDAPAAAALLEELGEAHLWANSMAAVASWLAQVPPALVETRPRLLLLAAEIAQWEGNDDLAAARLERAAALLARQVDAAALAEAEARRGHLYLIQGEPAEARRWIEAALGRTPAGADRVRAFCLVRLAQVEFLDGAPARCAPLLQEALGLFQHLGDRLGEAWALFNLAMHVYAAAGDLQDAVAALHRVTDLCAGSSNRLHGVCLLNLGSTLSLLGRHAEGRGYLQRALEMANALAFAAGKGYALAYLGRVAAETGDYTAAAAHLDAARQIEGTVKEPQLRLETLAAAVLLQRRQGLAEQALESARQHLAYSTHTRNPYYLATSWYQLVLVHVARGAEADAARALAQAQGLLAPGSSHHTRFLVKMAEAVCALALPGAVPGGAALPLAEAMAVAARQGYEGFFLAEGEWGQRLLLAAEQAGLAPEFVRRLRARCPGPAAGGAQPEAAPGEPRLRLWLLGGFAVELDGAPLPPGAWRGQKPRELAKLLALELGRPVSRDACLEALWPQLDAEAAGQNFRVTLHWLRRALGAGLVQYSDSRCALDPALTWCDVAEFRQLAAAAAEAWRQGDAAGAAALFERCVHLYRGDLLAGEPPGDWQLSVAEELREAYLQALSRLALVQARAGALEQAVSLARRVVDLDPEREQAYRLLMRVLARSGRHTEVQRIYRQCEENLRRSLGVTPGASTRELFAQLMARHH